MGVLAVGGGSGELRRIECSERSRTYGRGPAGRETARGTVDRLVVCVVVILVVVVVVVVGVVGVVAAAAFDVVGGIDEAVGAGLIESGSAGELSTVANKKDFVSVLSTGPADSGGVAVMVLGKTISCWRLDTAGEMGCAVRGVSGYVEGNANGVGAP